MLSIKSEKINKTIDKKFSYDFETPHEGVYFFEIIASAKSRWQNLKSLESLYKDDDLALRLDDYDVILKLKQFCGNSTIFDSLIVI